MPRLVAMLEDLMFLSRLREAGPAGGVELLVVRTPAELVEACRSDPTLLVVLDLDSPRVPALEGLRALRAEASGRNVTAVGFFSHVRPERGREALAAGCSRVLPRSLFVKELRALLTAPPG